MNFKRIIALLLLLCTLFSLFSCVTGELIDPSGGSSGPSDNEEDGEEDTPPEMNDDPTDDFTVSLFLNGQPYSPRIETYAIWTDGFSTLRAKVDENGVARIDGLDGDYRVRLSAVPNELAYDPNSNIATNYARDVRIDLYSLNVLTGTGNNSYDGQNITSTGVYTAKLNSADEGIFFSFSPKENGIYTIESWADVAADDINPYCDVYVGSFAWNTYQRTIDDGGSSGSYTTNFKHNVNLSDDMVGNNYIFAVKADSRNNVYPITVTFAVKRDGRFDREDPYGEGGGYALPTYDFTGFDKSKHEYGDDYVIKNPEYLLKGNTYVFDERRFKVWEKSDGGDGFYHVFDEVKYAETDGYGPILYAYITKNTRFIDRPFSKIEYSGKNLINSALTVNRKNYKVLIEGYQYLTEKGNVTANNVDVAYFCEYSCPCHGAGATSGYACVATRDGDGQLIKCSGCNAGCEPCPEELFDYVALFAKDEHGNDVEILDPAAASVNMKGGRLETITYNGKTYALTLKEKGEADKAILSGTYKASLGETSFDVRISDTGIAFTLDGKNIYFTYVQGFRGYQHYANSDGLAPVTPELRDFLFAYNDKQKFFNDGKGSLEENGYAGKLFQSVGNSGWLFGCAYYEKIVTP